MVDPETFPEFPQWATKFFLAESFNCSPGEVERWSASTYLESLAFLECRAKARREKERRTGE